MACKLLLLGFLIAMLGCAHGATVFKLTDGTNPTVTGSGKLGDTSIFTVAQLQAGKTVGFSYTSGIFVAPKKLNMQVTLDLTKDAKPFGAGKIYAVGFGGSEASPANNPERLSIVGGTGAYARLASGGGFVNFAAGTTTVSFRDAAPAVAASG